MKRIFRAAALALAGVLIASGCGDSSKYPRTHKDITFVSMASSNTEVKDDLRELAFVDVSGKPVKLSDYIGPKHLVLVITRGYYGDICIYCSTQVSRLIARYDEFNEQDAQVVVVYPLRREGDKRRLDDFVKSTEEKLETQKKPPFPILLDVELNAVNKLDIAEQLAKPATYIIDKQGEVRFAYVGANPQDRPSVTSMITQLKELNSEPSPETSSDDN